MRSQQPSRLVQQMVIIAIIGILAAIVIPAMKQARDRAARTPMQPVTVSPADYDGMGNTIELSEVSDGVPGGDAGRGLRALEPLIPIALALAIIVVAIRAAKRGPAPRA